MSLSKTRFPLLSTGSTSRNSSKMTKNCVIGRTGSTQTKGSESYGKP